MQHLRTRSGRREGYSRAGNPVRRKRGRRRRPSILCEPNSIVKERAKTDIDRGTCIVRTDECGAFMGASDPSETGPYNSTLRASLVHRAQLQWYRSCGSDKSLIKQRNVTCTSPHHARRTRTRTFRVPMAVICVVPCVDVTFLELTTYKHCSGIACMGRLFRGSAACGSSRPPS